MIMKVTIFWVLMPCDQVDIYLCFGGTYCLHLHGPPKHYLSIYQTKRRHLPEGKYLHRHHHRNIKLIW
jgi:hypothetical protein